MKYYQMSDKVLLENWDGTESVGLYMRSHALMQTKTGDVFVDYTDSDVGAPFEGALICDLDDEDSNGIFPTFFRSPALIGTKAFYQDLLEIGIRNIEVHPVIIHDRTNHRTIEDYVLLNVIGRVPCEAMDDLVVDTGKLGQLELFLVHEDTNCILVSERVYRHLINKGYTDIFFEEVKQM
ncbi:hypothetical protein [Rhodoferax saidenbachensis]|uniref:Uncharacterized protein n=1 Tax=Rhodoferax saidenbachensis TaxID=1484693 RepID=A0ABU1ZQ87_9BURK|nr:hypothetical protein [Rhodoferax saidenbachensis]MDR7307695.1 hypothetical protein [Rhodoferax saidenbachensis]